MPNQYRHQASLPSASLPAPLRLSCPHCKMPLPLRTVREDEQAATWECSACHHQVVGRFLRELAEAMASQVRLAPVHFDAYDSPPIPPVLRALQFRQARLFGHEHSGAERRRDDRVSAESEAVVACLDERWVPQGRPVRVLVVELAPGGLRLITRTNARAPFIAIQMAASDELAQYVAEPVWYDHLGCGFHHVGIKFIQRLGSSC